MMRLHCCKTLNILHKTTLNTLTVWGLSHIGPYHGMIPKQHWNFSQTLCPELQWDNLTSYKIGTGGSHLHCAVNILHLSYPKIQNIWTLSFTTSIPIQMEKAGFIFSTLAILQRPWEYEFMYFQFCTWMCQFFVHCSWHEMGAYDLPAVVDYILNATGEQKLYYIGHSMGTTMFYVFMSERPQYKSKISAMFSLAPAAFLSHMANPLRAFIHNGGLEAINVCHSTKLNIQITQ